MVAALGAGQAVDVVQQVVFVRVDEPGFHQATAVTAKRRRVARAVAAGLVRRIGTHGVQDAHQQRFEERAGFVDGGVPIALGGGRVGLGKW